MASAAAQISSLLRKLRANLMMNDE